MDNGNPNSGNMNRETNKSEGRRNLHRRAARRPSQLGAAKDRQPEARRAPARDAQDSHPAQKTQPNIPSGRPGSDSKSGGANHRADERLPVTGSPREQLRRLELDGARLPQADIARRNTRKTDVARPVQAPLPREVQFEAPVIDPEILRRSASERQRQPDGRTVGRSKIYATSDIAETKANVARPAKPLPQRAAGSASGGKIRVGYKRADEFLPEKLTVTGDKRVITESSDIEDEEIDIDEADSEPARRGSALSSLLKAIVYIVFVLTVSAFLSFFIISIGNDIFAFVKPNIETTVTVPEFATIDNIADILSEKGVIKYPFIFKLYAVLRNDNGAFVEGEYVVTPSMSYDQLRAALKGPVQEREQISITIPEGYTVDQIIDLFVEQHGMGTREGFINAIENGKFDYWFLEDLQPKEGRKYRLEGYLYPDTYYFFTDWSEEQILRKFLNNFNSKFDRSYEERCKELGMTVDELITLASMIEAEGKFTYEFGAISAVFHNRLNNPSVTDGKLESDATIQYVLPERHEELTTDDLVLDSPYNTYRYPGLPPGPITNPTINAIHSAMYPDDVNYYYFVARPNGQNLFAVTYQEHLVNKRQAAEERAAMKSQQ